MAWGASVFFNWRFVGTAFEPRSVSALRRRPPPSRARFLRRTALTVVVCYLLLDLMDASADSDVTARFYRPDQVGLLSRLSDVSAQELLMRFFAALGLGAGLVSVQRGVYCVVAFVCVAAGVHAPADWPPFNGPFGSIYSLRNLWSVFWHQTNTHKLVSISNFILGDLLRLPRSGRPARFLRLCIVFLVSGLFHVAIDVSSGIDARSSGALRFFAVQPLGILAEDLFRSALRSLGRPAGLRPSRLERCAGALWVALWMTWVAPEYLYPILNATGSGDKGVVPVSIIGAVRHHLLD
ncbi:hypothetical protein CDD83_7859 [Cordyceps sp. RAO-2017]|nr:hypothetical protein CDD83_7859 [Cordyceps sp. RAO-2017]